jgi:hypothetical protein
LVLQASSVVVIAVSKNIALRMIGIPSAARLSARSHEGTNDAAEGSFAGTRLCAREPPKKTGG